MKTAPVAKLKASLSDYLRLVKAGEEVIVTERGKPIARLSSLERVAEFPQHLIAMERQGRIKLGSGRLPRNFWKLPRPKDPKGLTLKALLEEREEGW